MTDGKSVPVKKLKYLIRHNLLRCVIFSSISCSLMILGGLMFFYIEHCATSIKTIISTKEQGELNCIKLCDQLQEINNRNETSFDQALINITKFCYTECEVPVWRWQCELKRSYVFMWMEYAMTVATTIGYGRFVAKTDLGKMVTLIYAIFTIPLTMAALSLCANVIKYSIQFLVVSFEKTILRRKVQEVQNFSQKCLVLECLTLITTTLIHATIYTDMKILTDSRFIESVYSIFIMTSTIGFGDFEYDRENLQNDSDLKKLVFAVSDLLFKFINLALLGSFFTTFSEFQLTFGARRSCKRKNSKEKSKRDIEVKEEIKVS